MTPAVGVVAEAPEAAAAPSPLLVEGSGSPAPVLAALSTDCLLASDMRLCVRVCARG